MDFILLHAHSHHIVIGLITGAPMCCWTNDSNRWER